MLRSAVFAAGWAGPPHWGHAHPPSHGPVTPLLAHQGGWDEILMVAAPIAVFGVLLWLANRRAQARLDANADASPSNPDEP
jgi:hypothetical protein